jgi:divinyl chlorophyllide a 8-vinyl-reductase
MRLFRPLALPCSHLGLRDTHAMSNPPPLTVPPLAKGRRVLLLGGTGTIGRATARALQRQGHELVCLLRPQADPAAAQALLPGAELRFGDVRDPQAVARDGLRGERFDALLSCLASRTGVPADAWAIDHAAHQHALAAAQAAGVPQMVLLSAICVQKPLLAFQQAKLAFERELMASGLVWSVVRPTAFFKSLSGQVERVRRGKPFLVFGDGRLTACKPISDDDLGDYLAGCLTDPSRHHRVLPIGGPGPAITPLQQAQALGSLLGREVPCKTVPVGLLDGIVAVLAALGRVLPPLAAKAELARIGRYYATESMLVWDAAAQRYSAEATPSYGTQTLFEHYAQLLRGQAQTERREHAVF